MSGTSEIAKLERDMEDVIAERDEAGEAVQRLDLATGGDGEYYYSTIDPDAPATPAKMCDGIAERYSLLRAERDHLAAVVADALASLAILHEATIGELTRTKTKIDLNDPLYCRVIATLDHAPARAKKIEAVLAAARESVRVAEDLSIPEQAVEAAADKLIAAVHSLDKEDGK